MTARYPSDPRVNVLLVKNGCEMKKKMIIVGSGHYIEKIIVGSYMESSRNRKKSHFDPFLMEEKL